MSYELLSSSRRSAQSEWIAGPFMDFFLIHGGLGLSSLPVFLCAFLLPYEHSALPFVLGQLIINFPHLASTYHHIFCKKKDAVQKQIFLLTLPLVIAFLYMAIMQLHWLPGLMLFALLLQTWHTNRQNFGIMRCYLRREKSDKSLLVNRCAEVSMEILPWATLAFACSEPAETFLGQAIFLPGGQGILRLAELLSVLAMLTLFSYLYLEYREFRLGRLIKGRLLCVLAASCVNVLAWVFLREISWGFLFVSIWHGVQYMTFVHYVGSERELLLLGNDAVSSGIDAARGASLIKYWLLMFTFGATAYIGLSILGRQSGQEMLALISLTLSMHHQLMDSIIWRKSRPVV